MKTTALLVASIVLALGLSGRAGAQLSCESAAVAHLGSNPVATLYPLPTVWTSTGCVSGAYYHAVYHQFTADQDGWYTAFVIPTGTN